MEYKDIFKPSTLAKLNKKSQENLKTMLGDKTLMQTMIQSQELLNDINKAEAPYREQLEELAKEMIEKLYPIIEEEGIKLDAKIVGMNDVNSTLDEIKINKPIDIEKVRWGEWEKLINTPNISNKDFEEFGYKKEGLWEFIKNLIPTQKIKFYNHLKSKNKLQEGISPEGRRRIINSISQGAALRGSFAFYLFKDYLDAIDPSLIDKYNQIMKNSFGVYDDDNAIAMMLSALAQNIKTAGGSSKVIINGK